MIALLDNYDSFTYNLVYLLEGMGEEVRVYQEENLVWEAFQKARHIILSPGPKHPKDSLLNQKIIQEFYRTKPILGVCLGHQCIAYAFGGEVIKAKEPMHGKTSKIFFASSFLFDGIKQGSEMMRYHSLVVQNLPKELEVIAWSEDRVIMGLKHRDFHLYGVQFHPESILSCGGERILQNFLQIQLH